MTSLFEKQSLDSERLKYWRGNLLGAATCLFVVWIGATIAGPLVPVLLHRDLGIDDARELALWTGICASIGPLMMGLTSPFWGLLADWLGRKGALARATLGAGLFIGGIGLVQSAGQLVFMRALSGATSGVSANALSLIASETPSQHLGRAIGVLTTARNLAQSVGPAVGGLAATIVPVRLVFVVSGVIILMGLGPVARIHETSGPVRGAPRVSARGALAAAGVATRRALIVVLIGQALSQAAFHGAQQLMIVRMIQVDPAAATLAAGIAFAVTSLAGALTGTLYTSLARRAGYLGVSITGAVVLCFAIVVTAYGSIPVMVIAAFFAGGAFGAVSPASASMLGMEAPDSAKATVFGVSGSVLAFAQAGGAFGGGLIAAALTPTGGLNVLALVGLGSAVVLWLRGREPQAHATLSAPS